MFGLSYIKLGIIVGLVAAAMIGGFAAGYHWEALEVARLETKYAEDKLEAMQAARLEQEKLDKQAAAADREQAQQQRALDQQAQTALQQVPKHVTNRPNSCIPWGAIRVLDGAILGRSADDLPYRAGIDDATCSPFTATQLVGAIVGHYAVCRANAAQLNALIALLRQYQGERK